jgi:hypothetical protein
VPTNRQSRSFMPRPDWVSGYQKDWLRPDVVAGLTTAATKYESGVKAEVRRCGAVKARSLQRAKYEADGIPRPSQRS